MAVRRVSTAGDSDAGVVMVRGERLNDTGSSAVPAASGKRRSR
jgi:hypothetical protein